MAQTENNRNNKIPLQEIHSEMDNHGLHNNNTKLKQELPPYILPTEKTSEHTITYIGLARTNVQIIRISGGLITDDHIRMLMFWHHFQGVKKWFAMQKTAENANPLTGHIDQGVEPNQQEPVTSEPYHEQNDENGDSSAEYKYKNFLTFKFHRENLTKDVGYIRRLPFIANHIPIYGHIFDIKTGRLIEIPEASEAGKALFFCKLTDLC